MIEHLLSMWDEELRSILHKPHPPNKIFGESHEQRGRSQERADEEVGPVPMGSQRTESQAW